MSIKVITPTFVKNFKCAGSSCPDTCCKFWDIAIDKKCYKDMLSHVKLKEFAQKHVVLDKKSSAHWGSVRLDQKKYCPMYGEDKLCGVYKAAGPEFMSYTCKVYPRTYRDLNQLRYKSLTMSCPEVARIILFDDDVFDFQQINEKGKLDKSSDSNFLPLWLEKTHNYAINLLLNNQVSIEEALLAIGILTSRADAVSKNQATTSQVDDLYNQLIDLINSGVLVKQFSNLMPCEKYQEVILNKIQIVLGKTIGRGFDRVKIIHDALFKVSDGKRLNVTKINDAWLKHSNKLLSSYPDLIKRYAFYYIYNTHFPLLNDATPSEAFSMMVLNYFIIRCYLAAIAEVNGGLSEENIVLCFQSFQSAQGHGKLFYREAKKMLLDLGLTEPADIISLLKI